jgi:hypothetical protein
VYAANGTTLVRGSELEERCDGCSVANADAGYSNATKDISFLVAKAG